MLEVVFKTTSLTKFQILAAALTLILIHFNNWIFLKLGECSAQVMDEFSAQVMNELDLSFRNKRTPRPPTSKFYPRRKLKTEDVSV